MKIKKYIISAILVLALITALTFTVSAGDTGADVSISSEYKSVSAGDTVVVTLSVDNISVTGGLLGLEITNLVYDEKVFTLESVEFYKPDEWTVTEEKEGLFFAVDEENFEKRITKDGEFKAYITLKVKETAPTGNTTITAEGYGISSELNEVALNFGELKLRNGIDARFEGSESSIGVSAGEEVKVKFTLAELFCGDNLFGLQVNASALKYDKNVLTFKSLEIEAPTYWEKTLVEGYDPAKNAFFINSTRYDDPAKAGEITLTYTFVVAEGAEDQETFVLVDGEGFGMHYENLNISFIHALVTVCDHSETERVGASENSCLEGGYTGDIFCKDCGKLLEEGKEIDAQGHIYGDWYVVDEPDCETEGLKRHDCINCDHYEEEKIDAKGHTESEAVEENRKDSDCENEGSYEMVVYCSVCNKELSREKYIIDAKGHEYEAVVTPPTCKSKGYTTYTCSVCGDSYIDDEKDALPHEFGDWTTVLLATCEKGGVEKRECGVCGFFESKPVKALGHNYESVVTPPTCKADGYTTHTCENCGDEYTDTPVGKLDHTFGEWATVKEASCSEKGKQERVCSSCGHKEEKELEINANKHSGETEVRDAKEATVDEEGYTGDTYCKGCGTKIASGSVIEKLTPPVTNPPVTTDAPVTPGTPTTGVPTTDVPTTPGTPTTGAPVTNAPVTTGPVKEKKSSCSSCSSSAGISFVVIAAVSLFGTALVSRKKK